MSLGRPAECVLSLPLGPVEKLVLLGLLKHGDYRTGGESFPKNETLRGYSGASESSVRRALQTLITHRWIKVLAPATRYKPVTYHVNIDAIVNYGVRTNHPLPDADSKSPPKRLTLLAK